MASDYGELLVEKERFEAEYQAYLSTLIDEEDEMQYINLHKSNDGGDKNVNTA